MLSSSGIVPVIWISADNHLFLLQHGLFFSSLRSVYQEKPGKLQPVDYSLFTPKELYNSEEDVAVQEVRPEKTSAGCCGYFQIVSYSLTFYKVYCIYLRSLNSKICFPMLLLVLFRVLESVLFCELRLYDVSVESEKYDMMKNKCNLQTSISKRKFSIIEYKAGKWDPWHHSLEKW